MLLIFWLGLPVTLPKAHHGPSSADCLVLADHPPAGPGAIPALERCATIVARDTELLADLGRLYETEGRLEEAERRFQQALAIDPDYADVRLHLGSLMLRRGALADAREQAEAGLRVQPNRAALIELRVAATRRQPQP
jgi:Flp pilus assembly protein TadD